ncbi:MAG: IS630 family transposase, partial [Tolypothrix sp. T3-bin4]|nr:IS630 family transposase [Tolypothrix sp. T3-bin4]
MKNFLLEQQQKDEKIEVLNQFIRSEPEGRELKRALAVKMALSGTPYEKIIETLGMHKSCITRWKQRFETQGIEGIKLGYQGAKSYLTPEQREEVIEWLRRKNYWNIDELFTYLDQEYQVIYQSKQSYYELMATASISWKKSQTVNPKYDPELVKKKREEIQDFVKQNQAEIETGQLIVLFLDECHLLGSDSCGYVWGRTDIRIEIPIQNLKARQTYYGALNYQTKEFIVREYDAGNSENTVAFIQDLQASYPGKRIVVIWDGASYHKSEEVRQFLTSVNQGYEPQQWPITCLLFAPNAPQQNPVEDVW